MNSRRLQANRMLQVSGRVVIALLVAVALLPFQAAPVQAADENLYLANWTKSPSALVFQDGTGTFDSTGRGVPAVLRDPVGTYQMWYTGYDASDNLQIGYATSSNGTVWSRQNNGNPVLVPGSAGAWDAEGVGSPVVYKISNSDYRMWYTGYQQVGGELVPAIGYATWNGTDATWTKVGTTPVLSAGAGGAFDDKGVHSPWVINDGSSWKMWYTGRTGTSTIGASAIGYATWDGTAATWTKANPGGNPVLAPTASTFDASGVAVASILKNAATGKYYMFYTGYSGTETIQVKIGAASSSSPDSGWTKRPTAAMSKEASGWNSGGVGAPRVVEKSSTELQMFYSGLDGNLVPQLGLASVATTTLTATVTLQGGERQAPGFQVPFTLKLFDTSVTLDYTNILSEPAMFPPFTATGSNVNTTLDTADVVVSVPSGSYKATLTSPHNLINVKTVTITGPASSATMGTLREGNANDDEQITGADFSMLLTDYLAQSTSANWNDGRCDFDRSGQVTAVDFSALAMNYNMTSPQAA